ncbi:hypothetical protein POM88_000833 [Heracleum sosnowskyi]|uniref:Uncharacterized protein n=1 Tax=Heracleum sosnowskyi TaxID=360622 RepID=A0AAD8JCB3_9APIA|nr:hypothetical protein POM88_000833 [Heracleum sosnowskyi]
MFPIFSVACLFVQKVAYCRLENKDYSRGNLEDFGLRCREILTCLYNPFCSSFSPSCILISENCGKKRVERWVILGLMVLLLYINTSTVGLITLMLLNIFCNPFGLDVFPSFRFGCRKSAYFFEFAFYDYDLGVYDCVYVWCWEYPCRNK